LLVKPNIGGRGAGIVRFDSIEATPPDIDEGKLEWESTTLLLSRN